MLTYITKTIHSSGNHGMTSKRRNRPPGKRGGHRNKGGREQRSEQLLEQPVAELIGTVPCQICGHPVDPKRMHFHMVRFHGAAFRPKRG